MKYQLTCLTPTLIGDGNRLSPIDYMLWKDQVNVLDQNRILKMLSKSPRLDTYLAQIRRADRLSFSEWGGYAQNYAVRRIPLENTSITKIWESAPLESLHIPTFSTGPSGVMLPGSALKGAIRTALVWSRWMEKGTDQILEMAAQRIEGHRIPRYLASPSESVHPEFSIADGQKINGDLKIYHVRTSRLQNTLNWKDSSPSFVEMVAPGTEFEGQWSVSTGKVSRIFRAMNQWSSSLLDLHITYAQKANLPVLVESLEKIRAEINENSTDTAILSIGWGTGFLGKSAVSDTSSNLYRSILKALPLYTRAIQTGLPFPKTRRVVHLNENPAALPGWVKFTSARQVTMKQHDTLDLVSVNLNPSPVQSSNV